MGSIKLGSTSINKMYLGSTEIKKVYAGSTLIWSSQTYSYSWSPIYRNNSSNAEPAIVGLNGTIQLKDSNGNVVATKSSVQIPSKGNMVTVGTISFTAHTVYSSLTAEYSYAGSVFSTEVITFSQSGTDQYSGTPVSVSFSFD